MRDVRLTVTRGDRNSPHACREYALTPGLDTLTLHQRCAATEQGPEGCVPAGCVTIRVL